MSEFSKISHDLQTFQAPHHCASTVAPPTLVGSNLTQRTGMVSDPGGFADAGPGQSFSQSTGDIRCTLRVLVQCDFVGAEAGRFHAYRSVCIQHIYKSSLCVSSDAQQNTSVPQSFSHSHHIYMRFLPRGLLDLRAEDVCEGDWPYANYFVLVQPRFGSVYFGHYIDASHNHSKAQSRIIDTASSTRDVVGARVHMVFL